MGAWIEIDILSIKLKHKPFASYMGAWIEIPFLANQRQILNFASYMGAWIEIVWNPKNKHLPLSHPIRMHELKPKSGHSVSTFNNTASPK